VFVKNYMSTYPLTVSPDTSVIEAMKIMRTHKIRKLPVTKGRELVGLVTEQDLLRVSPSPATTLSVFEQDHLLSKLPVKQAMVNRPVTIEPEATIEEAALLMREHKVSCLPVLENGELVGIITQTDIFDALLRIFGVRRAGRRILLEAEDRIGALWEITGEVKDAGINIVSALTEEKGEGKAAVLIRVQADNVEGLVQRLEQKGYKIINVR